MDFLKEFSFITEIPTKLYMLKSMFLTSTIKTDQGMRRIIEEGMEVSVKDNSFCSDGELTHVITLLRGNLSNTRFEVSVINKKTFELSMISL